MTLIGIATRVRNSTPMVTTEEATISLSEGIIGDFRRRPGKRQITLMSAQQWQQACDEIGSILPWTTRRANLLIDDIQFGPSMLGKVIKIGEVELQVMDETEPCHKMDQQHQGLRAALTPGWRGGVCCKVIRGGQIRLGDTLSVV